MVSKRISGSFIVFGLFVLVVGVAAGIGVERLHLNRLGDESGIAGATERETDAGEREILYWVAPMDRNYRRDGPGKSPMGMDLIPVYAGDQPGAETNDEVITLSPATVQNLGVRTAVVERTTLRPTIETFGVVAYDETRTSHVHVRAEGWIERLNVRSVGEIIDKDQVLFEVFSPELAIAAWEYVRELEQGDQRTLSGGPRKLLSLGADPRQVEEIRRTRKVPERIKVYAPRSGVAVALNVAEGMFVEPDMTTISITDPSVVWLMADVFESQAALVRSGMEAEIRLAGMPGRVWTGAVEYVYPDLRPETRTIRLRLRLDNPGLALKPNMYASVSLATEAKQNVLAVPHGAVIRTGRSDRIVRALGGGRFEAVPVKLGQSVGERFEILEGVSEGDRVVVSAQFLIDSESNLAAGLRQMEDVETAPEPPPTHATGRVDALNLADRKATLTHDPIPALGWPAMTMDFALADGLDTAKIEPGGLVEFDFVNLGSGAFSIVEIRSVGEGPANGPDDGSAPHTAAVEPEAWTVARINGPGASDRSVNVSHEPIPALGWPAMTMDLEVDASIAPELIAPGRRLRIGLAKGADGLYRIVAAETSAGGS